MTRCGRMVRGGRGQSGFRSDRANYQMGDDAMDFNFRTTEATSGVNAMLGSSCSLANCILAVWSSNVTLVNVPGQSPGPDFSNISCCLWYRGAPGAGLRIKAVWRSAVLREGRKSLALTDRVGEQSNRTLYQHARGSQAVVMTATGELVGSPRAKRGELPSITITAAGHWPSRTPK